MGAVFFYMLGAGLYKSGITGLVIGLVLQFVLFTSITILLYFLIKGMVRTFKRNAVVAMLCVIFLFPIWIIWSIFELFMGKVKFEITQQDTMRIKYIGALFLSVCVCQGLGRIVGSTLSGIIVIDSSNFNNFLIMLNIFFITSSIAYSLIFICVVIFVYNIFDELNMKKAFPYLVGFYGLMALYMMGQITELNPGLDVDFTIFYLSTIVSYVVAIYAIRSYYIGKPDRWYKGRPSHKTMED